MVLEKEQRIIEWVAYILNLFSIQLSLPEPLSLVKSLHNTEATLGHILGILSGKHIGCCSKIGL